jgi:CHAD domain-containing protein
MNPGTLPAEDASEPDMQEEFRNQMQQWRHTLATCSRKPGRKCVHELRVATLRIQAAVEYWLSEQEPAAAVSEAALRWLREGKKLRRALGPVRQADVSLAKLERVREWAEAAADGHLIFPGEGLSAIAKIVRVVKRERDAAARKLAAEVERRRKRLNRASKKLETVLAAFIPAAQPSAADKVPTRIAAVATEYPTLDSENLHEFRKQIKNIRYFAEVFAPRSVAAAQWSATLKRMTGAVGEWHDWQILTREASRANRGDVASAIAAEFLQAQAGRSLNHALELCRRSMARLLAARSVSRPSVPRSLEDAAAVPRKPVACASESGHPLRMVRAARAS